MKFIQKNWKNLLIIFLLLLSTISTCTCKKIQKDCGGTLVKIDTVYSTKVDTIYKEQPTVILPTTTPIAKQIVKQPSKVKAKTSMNQDVWDSVCTEIQKDYYSIKNYNDTIHLKDSAGNDAGSLTIGEQVVENSIFNRIVSYKLRMREIVKTNTVTITKVISPPPKNHYYIGAEVLGNQDDIVNGASIKFLMQNKKSAMFGVSVGAQIWQTTTKPEFGVSFYKRL